MNGAATVSPRFMPNFCKCGHDLAAHSWAPSGAGSWKCTLCNPILTTANANNHFFESPKSEGPVPPKGSFFLQSNNLQGYINAGGFGRYLTKTNTAAVAANATSFSLSPDASNIMPGMAFYVYNPGNVFNSEANLVVGVAGNVITLATPMVYAFPISTTLLFWGMFGAGMGAANPANGQRAG